ncbi:MAG: [protein-PII] uridylyltransferase [Chthoniobacterales bacterium]|nr:[protein-PII] uridylyltransferase [Chthoniobacterales bacterium]
MSYNLEKILERAGDDLEKQTEGRTTAGSLAAYQRFRRLEEHRLRLRISSGAGGREVVRQRSDLVDILSRRLFTQVCTEKFGKPKPEGFTAAAFGGYGRREMNPFSDVDIMFLHSGRNTTPEETAAVQEIIRMLWDIGFKVGHSVRSVAEAIAQANEDLQTKTSMLESRYLCGDREVFNKFRAEFGKKCVKGREDAYVAWRLVNQRELHEQYGRIVSMQEPNIKHGMGGLRDYQNLLWIGAVRAGANTTAKLVEQKFLTESERGLIKKAYDFLLRVRTEMHFINKRPIDSLTLYLQGQIATRLDYPQKNVLKRVEEFMRDYYRHTRNMQRVTETAVYRMMPELEPARAKGGLKGLFAPRKPRPEHFDGFYAKNGQLHAETTPVFTEDPQRLMRMFQHAQVRRLELSPGLRDLVRKRLGLINRTFQYSRAAREVFFSILSRKGDVGRILRMMHETDFLGRYLPEFGRLTCLVQHEFFHRYTADEHTLVCIDKLDELIATENPKLRGYRDMFHVNDDPAMLYLALLLHDTGKAEHRRHHEEASATMASKVGRRLQLTSKQKRELITLVDNHGLLSKTAQSRNLEDPATIAHLCGILQSPEYLDPLMLVTLADGQGTSDSNWSDWKEGLVWQLHRSARACFEQGAEYFEKRRIGFEDLKNEVRAKLAADYADELEAHFVQMPERYFRTFSASEIAGHLRMFRQFYQRETQGDRGALSPVIKWMHHPGLGHSEVLLYGWDHPGLIRRICGAFLGARINVLSADIHTRTDNLVLDIFRVCDARHEPVDSERDQTLMEKLLNESLAVPEFDFAPHIAKARQKMGYRMSQEAEIPTRITIDNRGHPSFTIVDIQTSDRIGLLYDLFGVLTGLGLSLELARITTEKEVALDTFYVYRSRDGAKISGEEEIRDLQRALHDAATGGAVAAS